MLNKETKLTGKQELFCQYYVSQEFFANGTQAYLKAYGLDPNDKKDVAVARSTASDNLTKPNILARINELLDSNGLNDQFVDKQLLFLVTQNADLSAKGQAIKEYNNLKKRITQKMEGNFNLTIEREIINDSKA